MRESQSRLIHGFNDLIDYFLRYGNRAMNSISFSSWEIGGDLVISCDDNGSGIPTGENEQIFEWEYGKDNGPGLTLSREFLSITGITIRETGEPGKGARFEMMVPKGAWRTAGRGA
jgi:K+-sensing histidine kinase KdpD